MRNRRILHPRSIRWQIAFSFRWDGEAGNHSINHQRRPVRAALWHIWQTIDLCVVVNAWSRGCTSFWDRQYTWSDTLLAELVPFKASNMSLRLFSSFGISRFVTPTICVCGDVFVLGWHNQQTKFHVASQGITTKKIGTPAYWRRTSRQGKSYPRFFGN